MHDYRNGFVAFCEGTPEIVERMWKPVGPVSRKGFSEFCVVSVRGMSFDLVE